MIAVPNSCFTTLFLTDYFIDIDQRDKVDMRISLDDDPLEMWGEWINLFYTLTPLENNSTFEKPVFKNYTVEVMVRTFVTNN